jgi:hypothetical protein
VQEWVEVAKWSWQSKGEDIHSTMAAWEIVDSDNEMYLMILNK